MLAGISTVISRLWWCKNRNESGFGPPLCTYRLNWARMRWMRWHCPPDTGLEIRALAVSGRARYISVTEAPHNTEFYTWMGKKHFFSFKPPRLGTEPRTPAWKAALVTTTLGPPPLFVVQRAQPHKSIGSKLPVQVRSYCISLLQSKTVLISIKIKNLLNPVTASAAYIWVFIFY